MNLTQLFLALRARYKIVLLTLAVTVAVTVVVSLLLPKTYKASTSIVLNNKGVDSVTGVSLPAQMLPGYIATQSDIIHSKSVALKVVDNLHLAELPAVQQQYRDATDGKGTDLRNWLADLLLNKLDIEPARESSVLTISFKGADPAFVAAVANEFANAYIQFSVQLKTDPAQQASGFINTQIKLLRDQYETAQSRMSKYQKDHDIFNADNRVDVETNRLNELSSQLVAAQSQAMDAQSRSRQAAGNAGTSPDVQNNALIQNLKASLAVAEAKLADTSQRLAPNHPQYISAKSEVDKLRSNLNEQIAIASSSVSTGGQIAVQRENELRSALAAQKQKVMALNTARDEFTVLANEVENARRAYELATQRYNQTSLESKSNQADIAVLSLATPAGAPSSPRLFLNVALSIIVGLILGAGAVLVMELLDQRVRSAAHLAETFGLPLLGVIEPAGKPTRRAKKPLLTAQT
ncbi:chain length determinant protein EpsF [Duganella sp. FT109W]|uniref:Chain length determinant protein EpsF n=1 Tax=Duganella margarita TaxID=2692170 RepID=A0ABW9WLM9_9BURK|nr:chain length determinant protein EpsF [Duganella margarita]MYN42054.1 chain length determinant protein EpsF [Duganella margarita]